MWVNDCTNVIIVLIPFSETLFVEEKLFVMENLGLES